MNDNNEEKKGFWASLDRWWKAWFIITAPASIFSGLSSARMMEAQNIAFEASAFFTISAAALFIGSVYSGLLILTIRMITAFIKFCIKNHKQALSSDSWYYVKVSITITVFSTIYYVANQFFN